MTMVLRINEHISKELCQLSNWSEFKLKRTMMAMVSAQSVQLNNRDEILFMAKYPDSKPIWDENKHY
jgi:hypothetical protein